MILVDLCGRFASRDQNLTNAR